MKFLIDTHIYLWALADRTKLAPQRLDMLQTQANTIYVSSVTIAELMIKTSIGKIQIDFDPVQYAIESGFEMLDYTGQDALKLKKLPFYHRDPFDRMLITQAMSHNFPIMTDDKKIKLYDCQVL